MTPLQIILISAIVFLIVGIFIYLFMSAGAKKSQKHTAIIRGGALNHQNFDEKDLQNKRRAEISKKLKNSRENEKKGKKNTISIKMQQAGLNSSLKKFAIYSLFSAVLCAVLAKVAFHMSPLLIVLFFVIGLFGVPRILLNRKIKKRQKIFLKEFADALEAVVRLLKAGMPVSEAISMITREYDGPVGEEMSIIYDKQKIGIPLHEAAQEGCKRMPLPEMKMFAAGLAIQAQTGSSLSDVLTNLAHVIRSRFRLKRKVLALSSEAIASASIIACLPLLVAIGLYFASPGYLDPLFQTSTGTNLLMGAGFWMMCGVLVMKQMINFKI